MAYSTTVLADSPLAYWRLGEASGTTAYDASSGGGADAGYDAGGSTPTLGAAGLLPGDADTSVTFARSGTQFAYALGVMPAGASAGVAIEAWVKFATVTSGTYYPVLRWWHTTPVNVTRARLHYAPSYTRLEYNYYDGATVQTAVSSSWTPTTGVTYHLVVSHDDSADTVSFYVNGTILGSAVDVSANGAYSPAAINGYCAIADGSGDYFDGTLDEVAIYNAPLSSTRVLAHYNAAFGPAWTTPADTVSMSTTPELKFTSPTSAVAQHFYLELDTANTFNTGNLRTYRSDTSQTNWDYWTGSAWAALPSTGLATGFSGNEIRYTVTSALSSATWYRRVRAGTLA